MDRFGDGESGQARNLIRNLSVPTLVPPATHNTRLPRFFLLLQNMGWTPIVGISLATLGFLGTILVCALPAWKVTAFIGANIVTAQVFWEGLWMNCVIQSTGHSQCKAYDSLLALPQELQASRALVCVSIGVGVVAIGLAVVGGRCTNFLRREGRTKAQIGLSAGVAFVAAGLLLIVPVSWSAHSIISGFYNPLPTEERRGELGASIYVGWTSGALLVLGGGVLCSSYRC